MPKSIQQHVLITLPDDKEQRKKIPLCTGLLDYFPAALAEVAKLSLAGNDQHNPGERLNWARSKSVDQADTIVRHLIQRGTLDTDGVRHSAKLAWRALALLQTEIELEQGFDASQENADPLACSKQELLYVDEYLRRELEDWRVLRDAAFNAGNEYAENPTHGNYRKWQTTLARLEQANRVPGCIRDVEEANR